MKPVKVLFVIDTLEMYGAERSLVALAEHFKNVVPVFVHLYSGSSLKPCLTELGIRVYSLNIAEKYNFGKAAKLLEAIYFQESPDIVHSTLYRSDLVTRKLKPKFKSIPLVNSWVTNSYNHQRYKGKNLLLQLKLLGAFLRDKYTSNQVDYFLANSFTIEKANRLALNISSSRTKVIHRGRKVSEYEQIPERKLNDLKDELRIRGKRILLNVGRLIPTKGQQDLIDILPLLITDFPDIVLIIAGEGKLRHELETEIDRNNLKDYVRLLGARSDVPDLLAVSDVFVFPSYLEGLSGSLIEAMMAEKIIVASDIPENLECVNSKTALIFSAGDKTDLFNKLIKVLASLDSYRFLGTRAKKVAEINFDVCEKADGYEKFYHSLVCQKLPIKV